MYKTKEEILNKIKEIEERERSETDEQRGVSETEISLLRINLDDIEN